VWFLDPNEWNAGLPFTVRCKVPAGEYLFLDTPSTECSNKEARPFYAKTAAGLVRCARRLGATRSSLVIDGQVASPSGVTAATNPFRFTSPARHNILAAPGVRSGLAAAYGQGLMLYPLSPGVHTLERVYQYAGGGIRVLTFVVTVP
jgi:hypothetical protein